MKLFVIMLCDIMFFSQFQLILETLCNIITKLYSVLNEHTLCGCN